MKIQESLEILSELRGGAHIALFFNDELEINDIRVYTL